MKKLILSFFVVLWATSAFCVSQTLDAAISDINFQTKADRSLIKEINSSEVLNWYQEIRLLSLTRQERRHFDEAFYKGYLPDGFKIIYQNFPPPLDIRRLVLQGEPVEIGGAITQQNFSLASGLEMWSWDKDVLPYLNGVSIKEPLRRGSPKDPLVSGAFPLDVPIYIKEIIIELPELKVQVPALEVQFQVDSNNISTLADYFGNAYGRASVLRKLQNLLQGKAKVWVRLKDVLQGWPAQWMNRFPKEKFDEEGAAVNDVCHGTARQFFSNDLLNGNMDRSTEATEWLLKTSYTRVNDNVEPQFGDYLYKPGLHSIRFILKDPNSGRWIGFSSYSSYETPYRIWWVDQDVVPQYPPSIPDKNLERSFDVWRPVR